MATAKANSSLKVISRPTQTFTFLAMNVTDPLLKNKYLRYAIRSAIDVPGIIKVGYNGLAARAYGIIPSTMKVGYWADAPHYNQDIPLAKNYMAQSGLGKVSLALNTLNLSSWVNATEVIAANLSQIGVKVSLVPQDSATYYAIPGNGGGGAHRQLNYINYTTEPDPYWSYIWFTCSQIGLWNWSDWCNGTFSSLLTDAIKTYDDATRQALYVQANKIWNDEAALIWICYPAQPYACQKNIEPSLRPDGIPFLWDTTLS